MRSNVTCGQVFLILVKNPAVKCHCGQMSRGQTSLAVKGPAVKCFLPSSFSNLASWPKSCGQMSLRSNVPWSNVPRSNVTVVKCPAVKCHCGQMSRGQMSLAVKCPAVKCHLRSNVRRSNVTVVKCHKILKWSKVRGQMSRGQMRLWS